LKHVNFLQVVVIGEQLADDAAMIFYNLRRTCVSGSPDAHHSHLDVGYGVRCDRIFLRNGQIVPA
jgi:hypothetical protein